MSLKQSFAEIRVYDGIAERTGVVFGRSDVRRRDGCCSSVSALARKARVSGDGTFYLPVDAWPADTERVDLLKRWTVLDSSSAGWPAEE